VITNKEFNPNVVNPSFGKKGKMLATAGIHARELTTGETCECSLLSFASVSCLLGVVYLMLLFIVMMIFISFAVTRFAEYLLQNYGADPEVTWVLDCE
jgi:hypothetical protein